jgi:hypothetical protein
MRLAVADEIGDVDSGETAMAVISTERGQRPNRVIDDVNSNLGERMNFRLGLAPAARPDRSNAEDPFSASFLFENRKD